MTGELSKPIGVSKLIIEGVARARMSQDYGVFGYGLVWKNGFGNTTGKGMVFHEPMAFGGLCLRLGSRTLTLTIIACTAKSHTTYVPKCYSFIYRPPLSSSEKYVVTFNVRI